MEIRTEYHTSQKTLFRRVNQIRNANSLYVFEEEEAGYKLQYCDNIDMEHVYIVLKGKDGQPFRLYDGQCGYAIHLEEGDVLVYECESDKKVWFSIPTKGGSEGIDIEEVIGYADYGTVSDMVQAGLIVNAQNRDLTLSAFLRDIKKNAPVVERKVPEKLLAPVPQTESVDREPDIFKLLTQVFDSQDVKDAMDKIQHIAEYHNKQTSACIRSHHVMHRFYCTGYSFFKGFQYTRAAQMRFGGRWMERAGFEHMKAVKIIAMKGLILIVPIRTPELG